jgi:hypothetical protein
MLEFEVLQHLGPVIVVELTQWALVTALAPYPRLDKASG